ncbi:hypothetical protein DFJ73DRAFT_486781 [Zopfochytrium polystomum]|nr:hypothetical protein DFJ73DRAFT_486781 [Zopfochytrium polystomum]
MLQHSDSAEHLTRLGVSVQHHLPALHEPRERGHVTSTDTSPSPATPPRPARPPLGPPGSSEASQQHLLRCRPPGLRVDAVERSRDGCERAVGAIEATVDGDEQDRAEHFRGKVADRAGYACPGGGRMYERWTGSCSRTSSSLTEFDRLLWLQTKHVNARESLTRLSRGTKSGFHSGSLSRTLCFLPSFDSRLFGEGISWILRLRHARSRDPRRCGESCGGRDRHV